MRNRKNNAWLRRFMKEHELSRRDVADAVCVNKSTIDRWLLDPPKRGKRPTNSFREMPDMAVRLLKNIYERGHRCHPDGSLFD